LASDHCCGALTLCIERTRADEDDHQQRQREEGARTIAERDNGLRVMVIGD
jgi:hypothetical protein